ncbi:AT hook domain-containing protein family protein [Nannizzia gypsea CBS 118893]|uniref:AT hook domain-containing protein family protein n=1 Tax=Arthroderma gypseum (strain ATCC MYA-4604 / CBS 118893) TaxID=535722 RepID=E4UWG5_ARTGP|nr:AT hook domain-containing protein family protein [Nannizzia gypsea CBS 118893]EFR01721.1 AT hook domain-containing protein family protein [Nannizzia gypsea CBS 118893]
MRNLRSGKAKPAVEPEPPHTTIHLAGLRDAPPDSLYQGTALKIIPTGSRLPGLTASEQKLLRQKQQRLAASKVSLDREARNCADGGTLSVHNGLEATLIFSQYEAGTAVCISSEGWVLTCAHCFGDTEEELQTSNKRRWLLFYTGLAVQAECIVWDARRDLALMKIVAMESKDAGGKGEGIVCHFPYVQLAPKRPTVNTPIICIGQPGMDDLESNTPAKNKFDFVELSSGKFRGMVAGGDWQDNSEIGQMKHDAWTYWGHSGAPLLAEADGTLIGLHSSWDDQTGMRHGVPLVAIREFLAQHAELMGSQGQAAKSEEEHTSSKLAVNEDVIVISD